MRKHLARGGLVLWLLATVVVATAAMATHELPLPVGVARDGARSSGWQLTHVVSARCPCSRRVADSLVQRGARADARERVVLLEGTAALISALEEAGFEVRTSTADQLRAEWGVEAAPVLIIRRPDGSVAYQGAYGPKRTAPPRDVELLARLRSGEEVEPWMLFGCAVSQALQRESDPLGLEY